MLINNIEIPSNINEFSIVSTTDNEAESPGLGWAISYNSPSRIYDVNCYIYNLGLKSIPNDINSDIVLEHYNAVKNDLYTAVDLGIYQDLKFNDSYGITSDRTKYGVWIAEVSIIQNDTIYDSYIYLTVFDNQFVKIRFTLESDENSSDISHSFSIALINHIFQDDSPFG